MSSEQKQTTWEKYVSAWKDSSPAGRNAALVAAVAGTCIYRDPLVQAEGHSALVDYMVGFHQQVPGGHFETTWFLAHHDRSIARWNMRDGAGAVIGNGTSYGEYDAAGKLVAITGFFETPAA